MFLCDGLFYFALELIIFGRMYNANDGVIYHHIHQFYGFLQELIWQARQQKTGQWSNADSGPQSPVYSNT